MIANETTKTSTQLVEFFAFSAKRVAFGYDDVDGPKRFHAQNTTTTPPMIVRTGTTSLPSERILRCPFRRFARSTDGGGSVIGPGCFAR